jgi:hypothetical protein
LPADVQPHLLFRSLPSYYKDKKHPIKLPLSKGIRIFLK